ncbi:hypothetical protein Pan216_29360 [Planctomycetes bacterium Pan216]|uniref:Uncharacterized protein n=1 Tax=Kolteria novifilia TaxID=2527975 RepID=A0A518B512_9BACT|nr:hypothetical protein Pan216_29360 [Planctomycetes bacterium Pan216]
MAGTRDRDMRLSDRLPVDWRKRISAYRGAPLQHYRRVMKTLASFDWMTQEERERAAFVIVEKEQLREQGQSLEEDDE